jgi:phage baseplate assembly protein gpV
MGRGKKQNIVVDTTYNQDAETPGCMLAVEMVGFFDGARFSFVRATGTWYIPSSDHGEPVRKDYKEVSLV